MVLWRQFFLHFGADDFPSEIPFRKRLDFFPLWRRDPVLERQFLMLLRVVLECFATRPLQIAVEWRRQSMHNTLIFCS